MLTQWFPNYIKPVWAGCYEVNFGTGKGNNAVTEYQYWNGEDWYYGEQRPTDDWQRRIKVSPLFHKPWRGLTHA